MAFPITIPRLGWTMEQGVFVGWLKKDGDHVRAGQPLFSLESEKSTEDIDALDDGILHIPATAPQPGDSVTVGTVIGYLAQQGETISIPSSPVATATTAPTPSVPQPLVAPTTAPAADATLVPPAISPRARRLARELGVDATQLQGTGRTGRIRERDVRAVARSTVSPAPIIPRSSVRKTIAERMVTSHLTTAPVTLTTTVDATNLVNLRQQFKAAADLVPSFTDFLVKLVAMALRQHPTLNARWNDGQIVTAQSIHIGIAVDTEAGLLVPIVRDVHNLSLKQVAVRAQELIARARGRQLTGEEMQGGTFTITNLGAFGIDAFTPIINHPEAAILGVGRISKQPVVVADSMEIRERLTLSLTFDHRIVDGAPAARFLQTVTNLIENPGAWLINGDPS